MNRLDFRGRPLREVVLQSSYIYGPVNSRRLGRSLGINPFPSDRKICTFDCLYCQYGFEEPVAGRAVPAADLFPPVSVVLDHLEDALRSSRERIDYITFSGNGEPTLHPAFPELVEGVAEIRDRCIPGASIALLSNGTTLVDGEIRNSLRSIDDPIIKLDAGDETSWKKINRPGKGVTFDEVVRAMERVDHIIIQSLFFEGDGNRLVGNTSRERIDAWLSTLWRIRPRYVQIYTLDRTTAVGGLRRVEPRVLEEIRTATGRVGIEGRVF